MRHDRELGRVEDPPWSIDETLSCEREGELSRFATCVVVFYVLPALLLNPFGQSSFIGYYLGVLTAWLAVLAARAQPRRVEAAGTSA